MYRASLATLAAIFCLSAAAYAGSSSVDPQTEGGTDVDFTATSEQIDSVVDATTAIIGALALDPATTSAISGQITLLQAAAPGSDAAKTAAVTLVTTLVNAGTVSMNSLSGAQQVQARNIILNILAATGPSAALQSLLDQLPS